MRATGYGVSETVDEYLRRCREELLVLVQVRYKDTTRKQDFRNKTFVTLKWKHLSKPVHMLINRTNQIVWFDQCMKSDQSDCLF